MPKSLQLLLVFAIAIIQAGCGKSKNSDKVTGRISDPQIARYVAANRRQAEEIAKAGTNKVPANYWKFFDAVGRDDMHAATNLDSLLSQERASSESGALQSELWHVYAETTGAYEMYCDFDGKWLHLFANDIITSIPKNSIYFGGTDPGRYIISAYCETHTDGRPFFRLRKMF